MKISELIKYLQGTDVEQDVSSYSIEYTSHSIWFNCAIRVRLDNPATRKKQKPKPSGTKKKRRKR